MEASLKRRISDENNGIEKTESADESERPIKVAKVKKGHDSDNHASGYGTKLIPEDDSLNDSANETSSLALEATLADGDSALVLDSLGDEIIIKIFSYLTTKDLLRFACKVNRRWNRLTRAPELWRHIVLDVNKLRLRDGMDYRPLLIDDNILASLTSLSRGVLSVDLTDCNALSIDALIALSGRCRYLRSLNLTRLNIALDAVLTEFALHCPLLEEVMLDNCSLGDDAVCQLVSKCQRLRKISFANVKGLSDATLFHLADHAKNLLALSLDRRQMCTPIDPFTDDALSRLAIGCPQLENLNISGLQDVSVKGVLALAKFQRLKTLDLARLNSSTTSEAILNQSLPLALLSVVDANAKTLESLNVSIVKRVDDAFVERLAKKAKVLRQLFVLDSTELTDKGLEALANHCLHLTKLDVSWCRKLTDVGVKYLVERRPTLRLLGLIRCDNVSDACVDQLMETHPRVEFQTFTLGCRQILMRAQAAKESSSVQSLGPLSSLMPSGSSSL